MTTTAEQTAPSASEIALLEQIRERVMANPEALKMNNWHCGTSHCLAGWAQVVGGCDMNDAMAEIDGRRLIPCASHLFFEKSDGAVAAWLETRAWVPENLPALHEKLRALNFRVFTESDSVELTGDVGDCWFDGSSTGTVSGQSGGDCRFYGSSTGTVSGQSGGACRFYGSSTGTVSGQSGGDCWFDGSSTGTVSGQSGGDCRFYGSSTGTVSGQSGGYCRFYGSSTGTVSGQSGGYCRAPLNPTPTAASAPS